MRKKLLTKVLAYLLCLGMIAPTVLVSGIVTYADENSTNEMSADFAEDKETSDEDISNEGTSTEEISNEEISIEETPVEETENEPGNGSEEETKVEENISEEDPEEENQEESPEDILTEDILDGENIEDTLGEGIALDAETEEIATLSTTSEQVYDLTVDGDPISFMNDKSDDPFVAKVDLEAGKTYIFETKEVSYIFLYSSEHLKADYDNHVAYVNYQKYMNFHCTTGGTYWVCAYSGRTNAYNSINVFEFQKEITDVVLLNHRTTFTYTEYTGYVYADSDDVLAGTELQICFSDGSYENVCYGQDDYDKYGISATFRDGYVYLDVQGFADTEKKLRWQFEARLYSEAPTVKLNEHFNVTGHRYEIPGSSFVNYYDVQYFAIELQEGETYRVCFPNRTEFFPMVIEPTSGNWLNAPENSWSSSTESYTYEATYTGLHCFGFECDDGEYDVYITEGKKIKNVIAGKLTKTKFTYAIDGIYDTSGEATIIYDDGTTEKVRSTFYELVNLKGETVYRDANGCYPIGSYRFKLYFDNYVVYSEIITIEPVKVSMDMSCGSTITLPTTITDKIVNGVNYLQFGQGAVIRTLLNGGESYHFSFSQFVQNVKILDPFYKDLTGYSQNIMGYSFTPESTGYYYLVLNSFANTKATLKHDSKIVRIEAVKEPIEDTFYYGVGVYPNSSISEMEFEVEYDDGRIVSVVPYDTNWYDIGFTVEERASSYEVQYGHGNVEGTITYIIKTAGDKKEIYTHNVNWHTFDKISILGVGETKDISSNATKEDGVYTKTGNSQYYRFSVEEGKTYSIVFSDENVSAILTNQSTMTRYAYGDKEKNTYYASHSGEVGMSILAANDCTVTLIELKKVESVEIVDEFSPTFLYGEEEPSYEGLKLKVNYDDGSNEILEAETNHDLWEKYGITAQIHKSDKKSIAFKDSTGNYAIGKYYWALDLNSYGYNVQKVYVPFEVCKVPMSYNVVFHSNDENDITVKQTIAPNKSVKLKANTFKRSGYEFAGWATTNAISSEEDVVYENAESVLNLSTDGADVNLYAVWKEIPYSITYIKAGGEFSAPESVKYEYMVSTNTGYSLPILEYSDEGYTFSGWYLTTAYKDSDKIDTIPEGSTGDYVLYAKWSPKAYTIKFDANGGTGTMKDLQAFYGIDVNLPKNTFKGVGALLGWSLDGEATEPEYTNMGAIDISALANAEKFNEDNELVLYAVWQSEFVLTFDLAEGHATGEESYADTTYTYGMSVKLPVPSKEGYIFNGWKTDTLSGLKSIGKTTFGDLHLVADWKPITYSVQFNANGGSGKVPTINVLYDESTNLPANTISKKGFVFAGWTKGFVQKEFTVDEWNAYKSDLNNQVFEDTAEISNLTLKNKEKVSLYAAWVPTEYTMEFDSQGGDPVSSISYVYLKKNETPMPVPVRSGYEFKGWYTDTSFKKQVKNLNGLAEDMTVYARWTKKYTIVFDVNGGSENKGMKPLTMTYDVAKALPKTPFTKDVDGIKYAFAGWSVLEASDEVIYLDGEKVLAPNALEGDTLILYAVWKTDFTVVFYSNGGSMNDSEKTIGYTYGSGLSSLPVASLDGCSFAGWYAEPGLKTKVTSIKPTDSGNKNLYAKWTKLKYTVKFNSNGPEGYKLSGKMSNESMVYDTYKAITKVGYKVSGFTCVGWSFSPKDLLSYEATTEDIQSSIDFEPGESVNKMGRYYSSEVTLYAVWKKDLYTITYDTNGIVPSGSFDTTKTYTVDDTVALPIPEKMGYTFLGWYTDAKCKKKATNVKVGTTGDKVFYAKWVANK